MSIAERIHGIIWNLGLLLIACAPVYVLIYWLEILGEKWFAWLNDRVFAWADRKFTLLEQAIKELQK